MVLVFLNNPTFQWR